VEEPTALTFSVLRFSRALLVICFFPLPPMKMLSNAILPRISAHCLNNTRLLSLFQPLPRLRILLFPLLLTSPLVRNVFNFISGVLNQMLIFFFHPFFSLLRTSDHFPEFAGMLRCYVARPLLCFFIVENFLFLALLLPAPACASSSTNQIEKLAFIYKPFLPHRLTLSLPTDSGLFIFPPPPPFSSRITYL